ncbi:MAG: alginate export family protein [Candidatus Omnitrophota bacterium]
MGRTIALLCALIGVVAIAIAPAYGEVQNIKISGDIKAMAVYRNNYDLEDSLNFQVPESNVNDQYREDDQDSFFMSVVRLGVDADLTDNVQASVRVANLREWDVDQNIDTNLANASGIAASEINEDDSSIILDLAYITLREMLYSPLTVVIGRQELNFGTGLIVGSGRYQDPNNSIAYNDLSPLHGYDAVRAILDYDPWAFNIVVAKIQEADDTQNLPYNGGNVRVNALGVIVANAGTTGADRDSDTDLYGVNVGYKFGQYNGEAEGYIWHKDDENYNLVTIDGAPNQFVWDDNAVTTLGLRGSLLPMEGFTIGAEVAGQVGEIRTNTADRSFDGAMDRRAMMANAFGSYDLKWRLSPKLGAEYLYTSGHDTGDADEFGAWDSMFRGKVLGQIRDRLESLYVTNDPSDTSGLTNQHTIKATCGLNLGELVDGLSMDMAYLHYWFDQDVALDSSEDEIGDELDMNVVYDYTEDVQFCLSTALFLPGEYYDDLKLIQPVYQGGLMNVGGDVARQRKSNDSAVSVIGSCKVTF